MGCRDRKSVSLHRTATAAAAHSLLERGLHVYLPHWLGWFLFQAGVHLPALSLCFPFQLADYLLIYSSWFMDALLRGTLWIEKHQRSSREDGNGEACPTQRCPVLPRAHPSVDQASPPVCRGLWPLPSAPWAFLACSELSSLSSPLVQPHPPLNSENTLIQHRGLTRCQLKATQQSSRYSYSYSSPQHLP